MLPHNAADSTPYGERIEDDTSAPIHTRRLDVPAAYDGHTTMLAHGALTNNRNMIAIGLIAIGLLAWLGRFGLDSGAMTAGMILLTISSVFLFFAFWKRIYGLLIPGAIVMGLAFGVPLADPTNGLSILWGLSVGFFAILGLGRTLFNVQSPWAIFPAVILFGVGMIIAFASLPALLGAGFVWLPLLLVAAGLYLGWGRRTA